MKLVKIAIAQGSLSLPRKFRLKNNGTIQKLIAACLLVVFTISAAPKFYFHELFADHKDGVECTKVHHTAVLHQQVYNCHFDELVVNAPFVMQADLAMPVTSVHFEKALAAFYCSYQPPSLQHHDSRGPPQA